MAHCVCVCAYVWCVCAVRVLCVWQALLHVLSVTSKPLVVECLSLEAVDKVEPRTHTAHTPHTYPCTIVRSGIALA